MLTSLRNKIAALSLGACLAAALVAAVWLLRPGVIQQATDTGDSLAAQISAAASDTIDRLTRSSATQELAIQETDLMEAVFRYEFEHNASGLTPPASTDSVYISLDKDHDPPPVLLDRFKDHSPPIEPVSAAGEERAEGVLHKQPGGRGIIFRIESIRWIDRDTVDVEGGYYCGGLCASGNTYRAKRKDAGWVVVKDSMHWIS